MALVVDRYTAIATEAILRARLKARMAADQSSWIGDPVEFAKRALGHIVWDVPADILRSVATNPLTAVKACHASSKTFTAAEAVLWWIKRFADGIAITTAPTWMQVERVLWGEIRKAANGARLPFPASKQTELRLGEANYALGLSTNEGVRFQGFHGAHVLVVLDEAPGVHSDIWEAIEGIRAGGNVHVLAIGNPTVTSGPFFDAFHSQRGDWTTYTISALDTPNLRGLTLEALRRLTDAELDDNAVPYLVTRRWVREKLERWGADSDLFRARVLGQFPRQGSNSLIALDWVEAANRARLAVGGPLEAGLDVARFGDDTTALCLRQGLQVVAEYEWSGLDTMRVCGEVIAVLDAHPAEVSAVKVDTIGVGAGVADRLREQGWPVVDVNVSEKPTPTLLKGATRFVNKRAELWWNLREQFRQNQVGGPINEDTQAELVGVQYGIDSAGRVFVESKEDAKKRGVASPNKGDAMMLAFAPVAPARVGMQSRRAVVLK